MTQNWADNVFFSISKRTQAPLIIEEDNNTSLSMPPLPVPISKLPKFPVHVGVSRFLGTVGRQCLTRCVIAWQCTCYPRFKDSGIFGSRISLFDGKATHTKVGHFLLSVGYLGFTIEFMSSASNLIVVQGACDPH